MTRTTRRILFYFAILVFFGVSYIVLLYAQGYKYSFSAGQFFRTGAVYLKTNTTAHVVLDGEVVATTSFLSNSASIGGLIPGEHIINVQKEGYSSWQKKVVVTEGFVEDYTHVLLLPKTGEDLAKVKKEITELLYPPTPLPTPTPTVLPTPKKKSTPTPTPSPIPTPDPNAPFYMDKGSLYVNTDTGPVRIAGDVPPPILSDDERKLLWYTNKEVWVYWLSNTNYQPVHKAGDIALVARFSHPIKAVQWFRGDDHIVVDVEGFRVVEIDTRGSVNIINI